MSEVKISLNFISEEMISISEIKTTTTSHHTAGKYNKLVKEPKKEGAT